MGLENTEIARFAECMDRKVPTVKIVCPRCDGHGSHTNPSIDGNGITASEMAELGEEFAVDYAAGRFDVTCSECRGANVVDQVDPTRMDDEMLTAWSEWLRAAADSEAERAAEMAAGC